MELIPQVERVSLLFLNARSFVLIVIALAANSNRKAIPWKTVLLGLLTQLIIGVGILKIPFIQAIFEQIGTLFIKVIEYTLAGSTFMFGDLSIRPYIFAFQVLPVILFFSAMTSILYYLGIIQRMGFLAWALRKVVAISGQESLSLREYFWGKQAPAD